MATMIEQNNNQDNMHFISNHNENENENVIMNDNHNDCGKNFDERVNMKQRRKQRLKQFKIASAKKIQNNLFNDDNDDTNDNKNNDGHIQHLKQETKQKKQPLNNGKNILVINKKHNSNINPFKKNNSQKQTQTRVLTIEQIMRQQANENTYQKNVPETNSHDDELIQQVLLESLVQVTPQKPLNNENNQNNNNNNNNNNNDQTNTVENKNELTDDYALALFLQQDEEENYQKILSKIHSDGKHDKVNTIDVSLNDIQNFDTDINQNNVDIDNYNNNNNEINDEINDEEEIDNGASNHVTTSGTSLRHDRKIWNKKYVDRLNEYDLFGKLNETEIHFNSQSYNSFKNSLDKKGFKKF